MEWIEEDEEFIFASDVVQRFLKLFERVLRALSTREISKQCQIYLRSLKINEAPPLHGCVPFLFYPQEYAAVKLCLQTARAVTCKRCFFQKLPLFKNVWFYIFPCTVVILPNIYKCFCLLWKNWSYSSLKQRHSLIQWNPSGPKQCHIIRLPMRW